MEERGTCSRLHVSATIKELLLVFSEKPANAPILFQAQQFLYLWHRPSTHFEHAIVSLSYSSTVFAAYLSALTTYSYHQRNCPCAFIYCVRFPPMLRFRALRAKQLVVFNRLSSCLSQHRCPISPLSPGKVCRRVSENRGCSASVYKLVFSMFTT